MKAIPLLLFFLLQFSSCVTLRQSQTINYTDQNNNNYSISRTEITFKAIKAVESSSGLYSGGMDKRVKITTSEFRILQKLAFEIMENDKTHTQKREMLTSVLWIKMIGESKIAYLYPSSLQIEFEKTVRKMAGLDS